MSVLNTLPAPVVQMGLVEKFVETEQNQPYVQQLVAQETARQELKRQNSRVPGVEAPPEGTKVRKRNSDEERQQSGREPEQGGVRAQQPAGGEEPEPGRESANPWSGNIVNLRI